MFDKIRQFMQKGRLEEAIKALLELTESQYPEYHNEAIALSARFSQLKREHMLGTISHQDHTIRQNQIVHALLMMLEEMEKDRVKSAEPPTTSGAEPEFVSPLSPPEFLPGDRDVPEAELPPSGKILYHIPAEMQLEKECKCVVRIGVDDKIVLHNFSPDKDTILQEVRLSEVMIVELIDANAPPAFAIRTISRPEQLIEKDAFTEWIFFVKPLLEGTFSITIKVSVIEIAMGRERYREIVLEEQIRITAGPVAPAKGDDFRTKPLEPSPDRGIKVPEEDKTVVEKVLQKGRAFLLLIAIDDYQHAPKLSNCVADAEALRKVLWERYQFKEEHTIKLYNKQATHQKILDSFDQLLQELTELDSLLFVFSGHGEYLKNLRRGYWIPVEAELNKRADYLNNTEVTDFINAVKARHVFGIVDSCFSEALFGTKGVDEATQRLVSIPSRWLLTAGRLEPVSDGSLGGHSPFAERLIRHLKVNEDDYLWVSELCNRVIKGMAFNAAKQMPRGEPLQDVGHEGGQFVLIKKA